MENDCRKEGIVSTKQIDDGGAAVDKSFRTDNRKPVRTVSELIRELEQLPPDMEIEMGFGEGVRVMVAECLPEGVYRCFFEENETEDDDDE